MGRTTSPETGVQCKYCNSQNVIRYGRFKVVQRWWCKDCHHKFASNGAKPNMKTPNIQVSAAVGMYYEGLSLDAIRKHLKRQFQIYPSDSTIMEWVLKYSNDAFQETREYQPQVSDIWLVDDTTTRIGGRTVWLWDVIDVETRYVLTTEMTVGHTSRDAQMILLNAARRAGRNPRIIFTRKLVPFQTGIETAFGGDAKQIVISGTETSQGNNLIVSFHRSLLRRNKVLRSLKNSSSVEVILNGWQVHQNYFRLHEDLALRTPSEMAGIDRYLNEDWPIPLSEIRQSIEACRRSYWQAVLCGSSGERANED